MYLNKIFIKKVLSSPVILGGKSEKGVRASNFLRDVDVRQLRPCEVVTDGARQPKFRPLFGTLETSLALAYRLLPLSLKARVSRRRIQYGTVRHDGKPRVFGREETYACPDARIPLVSRDAASSRSGLPIPSFSPNTRHPGGFFPPISRAQCAGVIYRGKRAFLSDVALVTRVISTRPVVKPSRERFSSIIFDDGERRNLNAGRSKEYISKRLQGGVIIRLGTLSLCVNGILRMEFRFETSLAATRGINAEKLGGNTSGRSLARRGKTIIFTAKWFPSGSVVPNGCPPR